MILADFVFALLIAIIVAAILGPRFGERGIRRAGVWPIFSFLFILILMLTWAGGIWVTPFGPTFWGGYWVPFLIVGLIIALVIAALLPPARPPQLPSNSAPEPAEQETTALAIGALFWVVMALLLVAIIIHYI